MSSPTTSAASTDDRTRRPFRLDESVAVLTRTPATLDALLRGLPEGWTNAHEGGDTWSPFDVIGHLIHCERADWVLRARIILEHGESRTFDPFDRFAQFQESKGKTLDAMLDEFTALRAENLRTLAAMNLTEADLDRRGRHPAFGEVRLGQLLATWTAHDLGHIAQIVRAMAKQYTEAVGPWAEYLSILRR
jgi:DinB superfamily